MQPKITMTLLVRNEADILEDNIRFHHAMGVDSFIVMDNLSTNSTPQILDRLAREIPITILRQEQDDYSQSVWVTDMARQAAQDHGADWVINNDADEFWLPRQGDLKSLLAGLSPQTGGLMVQRHNAVLSCPSEDPLQGQSHPRLSAVFEGQSLNALGRPLPGKILHRASKTATIAQGNHAVEGAEGGIEPAEGRIAILHFPYRSLDHYRAKIRLGGAAYARNSTLAPEVGETWRRHFAQIDSGSIEEFWAQTAQTREEITIGLHRGALFRDARLQQFFKQPAPLETARQVFLERTGQLVQEFAAEQARFILQIPRDQRWQRPMYYNQRFALSGAEAHLERLTDLTQESDPRRLTRRFDALRDAYSLFPRNGYMRPFLRSLLEQSAPEDVARLQADCDGKRVILHTSCLPRLETSRESQASFAGLGGPYHHIILHGQEGSQGEDRTPLGLAYDGHILRVPVPDDYESLHRKLFYAYMLFDLLTVPEMVVKLDDNILLLDAAQFAATLDRAAQAGLPCAGRRVGGRRHNGQWHGWHLGKCADPRIEARGYPYPLPRDYAAGGYGYVLLPDGLGACSYMYLAMKEFFAMPAVGLEDACVGHALYAQDMELLDLSDQDHLLALPGLTTREAHRRQQGWQATFRDPAS